MIEAKELTMYYGNFLAVQEASFSIEQGEIVGLLGPNGAGKTTIMKMLTTFLHPSSGSAIVGGNDIITNPLEARKIIGYLPETLPLYPGMEVRDYLIFVGRARGLSGAQLDERLTWVKERCGLTRVFRKPIIELSKGYKQRTGIAQALIHDPQVVILDEPINGLDPHQIIGIRTLIEELAEKRTVMISTHILQEMVEVTQRFIIIDQGHIVADGSLSDLRNKAMKHNRYRLAVKAPQQEVESELKHINAITSVSSHTQDNAITLSTIETRKDSDIIHTLNELIVKKKWLVHELQESPFSLEETFLSVTNPETEISSLSQSQESSKEGENNA